MKNSPAGIIAAAAGQFRPAAAKGFYSRLFEHIISIDGGAKEKRRS